MTEKRLIRLVVNFIGSHVVGDRVGSQCRGRQCRLDCRAMDSFTNPDGTNYFAFSVKPEGIAPAGRPRDVLVMFNTSASQTGEYRTKALEALQGLIAGLCRRAIECN